MGVRTDFVGARATITLDRPAGNRIDFAMRHELRDAVGTVAASNARVLVVRGAGPDFCCGGDVREWIGMPSSELRPKIEVYADALRDLAALPIPSVAVVQGRCMGGGFELALACDFIIATSSATFRFPEAVSGILTLQGGALVLAERVSRTKALELVLLAEPVLARQLAEWSVVSRVADDEVLEEQVASFVVSLSQVSPAVCAETKRLLRIAWERAAAEPMRQWYEISMPLFDTGETQQALALTARKLQS